MSLRTCDSDKGRVSQDNGVECSRGGGGVVVVVAAARACMRACVCVRACVRGGGGMCVRARVMWCDVVWHHFGLVVGARVRGGGGGVRVRARACDVV